MLNAVIMVRETPTIKASGIQCQKQEHYWTLDLSKYTRREKSSRQTVSSESHLRSFCHENRRHYFFPATLCKAELFNPSQSTKFFWEARTSVPSKLFPRPEALTNVQENVSIRAVFFNQMRKVPVTKCVCLHGSARKQSAAGTTYHYGRN
ncbi:hypothetical protein BV898_07434 [Hypsibius exemplaris]|uniref:Uncharacterized protein n=1 Tax=Hypsibius exemplaris TaxID=2072580 RepID=A0A1W0WTE3_HYPEX|nr:hypothetical protein BV898_07434 [Hypsibius exemplaris]